MTKNIHDTIIIVKLKGGLGNQLFQYALGFSLAKKTKHKIFFDTTFYQHKHFIDTDWPYALNHFQTHPNIFQPGLILRIQCLFMDACTRLKPECCRWYIRDQSKTDIEEITKRVNVLYLDGYWQNEKYFQSYASELRHEFEVSDFLDRENAKWLQQIEETTSVCLHVRRGDYISDARANKHHGVCSLDYYNNAINYILENVQNPHFYVFSDDIPWAKENIPIQKPVDYMEHNDALKNYDDLRLMYNCKHFIIANSSFSWWGAWLGRNPNKIIIAPKKWNNNPEHPEIVPKEWIRL